MKFIKYCIIAAAAVGFASCSSDNNGEEPEVTKDLTITSATNTQLLNNNVYAGTEVSFTFSEDVTLNMASTITLDGAVTTVTPTVSGKNVTMSFYFEGESTHTISIGRYAFKGASGCIQSPKHMNILSQQIRNRRLYQTLKRLSNASATKEAKNVYNYLVQQNGKKILSGAMANVNNNNDFADWIYKQTNKYPALTCYDFIHFHYSGQNWIDYSNIKPAQTQWNNNGLVAYMWHWVVPKSQEDYNAKTYSNYAYRCKL